MTESESQTCFVDNGVKILDKSVDWGGICDGYSVFPCRGCGGRLERRKRRKDATGASSKP